MNTDRTVSMVHLQATLACHVENIFTVETAACQLTCQATFSDKPRGLPPGTVVSLMWCTAQCNNSYESFQEQQTTEGNIITTTVTDVTTHFVRSHGSGCYRPVCTETVAFVRVLIHDLLPALNSLTVNTIGSKQFLNEFQNILKVITYTIMYWICVAIYMEICRAGRFWENWLRLCLAYKYCIRGIILHSAMSPKFN